MAQVRARAPHHLHNSLAGATSPSPISAFPAAVLSPSHPRAPNAGREGSTGRGTALTCSSALLQKQLNPAQAKPNSSRTGTAAAQSPPRATRDAAGAGYTSDKANLQAQTHLPHWLVTPMGFRDCCWVHELLGCPESRAFLRREKQERGRSATGCSSHR